jgi:HK97 gp10 family phage protein
MESKVTLDVSVLEKLGLAVDAGLEEALLKYGQEVIDDAKTRCPVKTGTLRDSLTAEASGDLAVTLRDGVEYGQFVEFPTRYTAAQPFLQPAIDAAAGRFPGVVASAVERTAVAAGGKGQPLTEPQP